MLGGDRPPPTLGGGGDSEDSDGSEGSEYEGNGMGTERYDGNGGGSSDDDGSNEAEQEWAAVDDFARRKSIRAAPAAAGKKFLTIEDEVSAVV